VPKPDPLAAALTAMKPARCGAKLLLPQLCTPEGLEAVKAARLNGLSFKSIADAVGQIAGRRVSEGSVRNWLDTQGIK